MGPWRFVAPTARGDRRDERGLRRRARSRGPSRAGRARGGGGGARSWVLHRPIGRRAGGD
ncbi:MAG: hypothetical protein EP329_12805 [Deltaproteobacteria bacterium]|nr:MAG: hypothetical protein EP329_12805 [Deltaproteobacteria bacterium]